MNDFPDPLLKGLKLVDYSILNLEGKYVIVLLCENRDQSELLMNVLKGFVFSLKATVDKLTGEYTLLIHFQGSEYEMVLKTIKTEDNYPPLVWLRNHLVKHITSGFKMSNGQLSWVEPFHSLDSINLN